MVSRLEYATTVARIGYVCEAMNRVHNHYMPIRGYGLTHCGIDMIVYRTPWLRDISDLKLILTTHDKQPLGQPWTLAVASTGSVVDYLGALRPEALIDKCKQRLDLLVPKLRLDSGGAMRIMAERASLPIITPTNNRPIDLTYRPYLKSIVIPISKRCCS